MKTVSLIKIFGKRYGGNVYREQALKALSQDFLTKEISLEAKYLKNRYFKIPESFVRLIFFKAQSDLWIRDFYSTVFLNKKNTKGKNISLIFHVDFSGFPAISRLPFIVLEKLFFYKQLRKADAIVVISDYWKDFFLKKGYKNVEKIYCGFDMEKFDISDKEAEDFKKQHNIGQKPIVYIGNCQKAKGALTAYKQLKDLDVHLVTSGKKQLKIPVLNFDLEYREYLKLLKCSSVAVTMSEFNEGWCMTAHEAMLCRVPVIGSGRGGMKELLEGGRQVICQNKEDLKEKVEYFLNNSQARQKAGNDGYEFARNFTLKNFVNSWVGLANKMTN